MGFPIVHGKLAEPLTLHRHLRKVVYFAACIVVIRAVFLFPFETYGPDFDPIWNAVEKYVNGRPVYDDDYSTMAPHYLYSPGATFLLGPIGLFPDRDLARVVMMLLGALCVLGATALVARSISAQQWKLYTALLVIVSFSAQEPVISTLKLTNINGFLLLMMVIFLLGSYIGLLKARRLSLPFFQSQKWQLTQPALIWAAIALAIAITFKPQFVALTAMSVVMGQWMVLIIAAVLMVVFFVAGWLTMNKPTDYVDRLLPYLGEPRDYNNGSIQGVGIQLGWSDGLIMVLTVLFLALVGVVCLILLRFKRDTPLLWLYVTSGALLAGVLMASGLMQGYYCMWLLPLLATFFMAQSPMRGVGLWIAYFFIVSTLEWPWEGPQWFLDIYRWQSSIAWIAIPVIIGVWAVLAKPRKIPAENSKAGTSPRDQREREPLASG